jgi:hypothetical protein
LLWAFTHEVELADMGRAAREAFEARYTAGQNHKLLLDAYRTAMARAAARQ